MIDGLWSVNFESSLGETEGGIIIFRSGEVFGGDPGHFYMGCYEVEKGVVSGEVEIKSYTRADSSNLFFGHLQRNGLTFGGKVEQPRMKLIIRSPKTPDVEITARCRKIADLKL